MTLVLDGNHEFPIVDSRLLAEYLDTRIHWALFALLIVHTLGMAFLVGISISMMMRVLGIATQVPLNLFVRFVPLTTFGLVAAILSGVFLVLSYPAKALTNPVFYFKLVVITAAFVLMRKMIQIVSTDSNALVRPASGRLRIVAALCLVLWVVGTTAGKFLAYTNTMLLVY